MNLHPWFHAGAPAALLMALPAAHADILLDNLAQPTSATTIVDSSIWAAQSFVTAGDPVHLLSIEIPIGLSVGGPGIVAELHADAGPLQVGATLATFVLPVVSSGAPQIELLPALSALPATLDLAPNTTYWIVLEVVGAGSMGWSYSANNLANGPGAFANYAYSFDSGASWLNWGEERPYLMRVNVSAVPELGSAALFFAGLLAIGALCRRRNLGATMACS